MFELPFALKCKEHIACSALCHSYNARTMAMLDQNKQGDVNYLLISKYTDICVRAKTFFYH